MVTTIYGLNGKTYYSPESEGTINTRINGAMKGVGSNAMYMAYTDNTFQTSTWINLCLVDEVTKTSLS